MSGYIKKSVRFIRLDFHWDWPFGLILEILRIPRGWLKRPQYWWLFALQINSNTSYVTISILGNTMDIKRKPIEPIADKKG
jgi:hypothetical protein